MKEVIVNILIFILFFNIVMLVFPEGKTQKYCKIVIKLFVLVYIVNNILLNGAVSLEGLVNLDWLYNYSGEIDSKREISIEDADREVIVLLNEELYGGEEVIENIILFFDDKTELSARVELKKVLNNQEKGILKNKISSIFKVKVENIRV